MKFRLLRRIILGLSLIYDQVNIPLDVGGYHIKLSMKLMVTYNITKLVL